MRGVYLLVIAAACHSQPPPQQPSEPLPLDPRVLGLANLAPPGAASCTEAAVGLERGTVDVRVPDTSIVDAMRARCADDAWPVAAIECFSAMKPGDLGPCAAKLPDGARDALFGELGAGDDRVDLARAQAGLAELSVNIAECDRFIAEVRSVMACDAIPLEARAQLGRAVIDFWSLPTKNLPVDATRRMANVCSSSLVELEQRAGGTNCLKL